MSILGRFTKQPSEILDYVVDFTEWFVGRTDSPLTFDVTADAGITIESSGLSGNAVKVLVSGGIHGARYKVTVRMITTDGIVKEADFTVRVREY